MKAFSCFLLIPFLLALFACSSQQVKTILVEPIAITLHKGEDQQLRAVVLDQQGNVMKDISPAWTSTNPITVQITNRKVTALDTGIAQIYASVDGIKSNTIHVRVDFPPVGSISGKVSYASPPSANTLSPSAKPSGSTVDSVPGEFIVKNKAGIYPQAKYLMSINGQKLRWVQDLAVEGAALYRLDEPRLAQSAHELQAQIEAQPYVEYAVPNRVWKPYRVPNDSEYGFQWNLRLVGMERVWDQVQEAKTVVAVVDTGYVPHPDLLGSLASKGYNFVTKVVDTDNETGRSPDALDLGDFLVGQNIYHGSHVAGILGAVSNNGLGISGVIWKSRILPVRVLGANGGTLVDIMDGIIWAAGGLVPGAPVNPHPARVINLSLGGLGECDPFTQEAINRVTARGAIVVAAAGNNNDLASRYSPGNCDNVITVGAVGPTGKRAWYSNYGPAIDVMAPGGDFDYKITVSGKEYKAGVLSTVKDDALAEFTYSLIQGTSMAAPHIAGLVALMKDLNPSLTFDQVKQALDQNSIRLTLEQCSRPISNDCGPGLADASKLLATSSLPPGIKANLYVAGLSCYTSSCRDGSGAYSFDFDRSSFVPLIYQGNQQAYLLSDLLPANYLVVAWWDQDNDNMVNTADPIAVVADPVRVDSNDVASAINLTLEVPPQNSGLPLAISGVLERLLAER